MGGSETAVIRIAEVLAARGHEVTVYTSLENPPASVPRYLPLSAASRIDPVDVFVVVRGWIPLLAPVPCKKRFFWTGESYSEIHSFGIGDKRVSARIDGALMVSSWQASTFCEASGFPPEKICVIKNGVHLPYFEGSEARGRKRLIYSSTPFRGLQLIPKLLPAIRAKHPDCELHVFSGFDVYAGPHGYVPELEQQFAHLAEELRKLPGVVLHRNVLQSELAREFMKSAVLLYPNTYPETSCITAMEAMAAGCAVLTSRLGALPETVGDAGVLVDGEPGSESYLADFIQAADRLLSDDNLFRTLSERGKQRAQDLSWEAAADRFEKFLREVHGLSI